MKTYTNKTLGFTANLKVPETAEEFDQLAGKVGACCEDATKNVIYRSWNHKFRAALCLAVEEESNIKRKTKVTGEGDAAKEVFDEKEQEYINRVIGEGFDEDKIQLIANSVSAEVKFDPTPSERKKKAPKEIVNNAKAMLAAVAAGDSTAERIATNFSSALGVTFSEAYGEVNEESVIAALLAYKAKQDAENANKFL